jgi:hypothetical protein
LTCRLLYIYVNHSGVFWRSSTFTGCRISRYDELLLLDDWLTVHRKYIPIYIQQDATLHSLVISGNRSTCFGWYFHPSSGAHTTVSTASGICHIVTAIRHYCGRVGTDLSVYTQTGSNSSMIMADSSNGVKYTRCCR